MNKLEVVIIGAGPGGLAAARTLASSGQVSVTLVQRDGQATFLPGILPILLGLRQASAYRHQIDIPQVRVLAGEAVALESGLVRLADGRIINADAIIAAPGLLTDATGLPAGSRSFPIWELAEASLARQTIQSFTSGRIAIAITSLPYRCPPAPYGLAMALQTWLQEHGHDVEVVLTTPEARPLQALGERASIFLETLAGAGRVTIVGSFHLDMDASRDGMLVATDGRSLSYDLGFFVPAHRRPAFLAELPGNGTLVQVDAYQRTALEGIWAIGDVTATPLPRAAGVAEAQGKTAAEAILARLRGEEPLAPTIPTPQCYVWTSQTQAARIQIRFPNGLPPAGKADILLNAPEVAIFTEALNAPEQWIKQLSADKD